MMMVSSAASWRTMVATGSIIDQVLLLDENGCSVGVQAGVADEDDAVLVIENEVILLGLLIG